MRPRDDKKGAMKAPFKFRARCSERSLHGCYRWRTVPLFYVLTQGFFPIQHAFLVAVGLVENTVHVLSLSLETHVLVVLVPSDLDASCERLQWLYWPLIAIVVGYG
jgi:hypothetical protein